MPSPNIHVTTSVDTTGLRPLEDALRRYNDLSSAIAQNFAAFQPPDPGPGSPAGPAGVQPIPHVVGGSPPPVGPFWSDPAHAGQPPAASDLIPHLDRLADALEKVTQSTHGPATPGAGYNLNSISGLETWVQNVLEPAQPVIDAMEASGQGPVPTPGAPHPGAPIGTPAPSATMQQAHQRVQRAQRAATAATTSAHGAFTAPSRLSVSAFDALHRLATEPGYVGEGDPIFQAAQNATGWSAEQVHAAAAQIADQTVQGAAPAQVRWTLNQSAGGGGSGGPGGPGGAGPASGSGGFGAEAAGALGGVASHYLPFLGLAGAAMFGASQIEGGWTNYSQQAGPMSDLIKQVGSANSSLESFRMALDSGSVALGITMPQVTAIATTLVPILGALSTSALAQAVTGVSSFAQGFGVPVTQATQIFSTAAQLGLTSGTGAPFTENSLSGLLGSMGPASAMTGRTGPLATGYLSAMQSVEQQGGNLVPTGSAGVANILAWMGGSGMQGLQGTRGASVFSSLNDAYTRATTSTTPGAGLVMAALQSADPRLASNPVQLLSTIGQGLGATLPGTSTTAFEAVMKQVKASFGSNPNDLALGLSTTLDAPLNTALTLAQQYVKNDTLPNTMSVNQFETAHHLHLANGGQQLLGQALNDTSMHQLHATVTRFLLNGGHMTPALQHALSSGNVPTAQLAFAQAEQAQPNALLTPYQQMLSHIAELGQSFSHMLSWVPPVASGVTQAPVALSRVWNPLGPLVSLAGVSVGGWYGLKGLNWAQKGIRGLLARSQGASPAEVAQADALDQAAQTTGETVTGAGSGVTTGLDVGSGVLSGGTSSALDMISGLARSAPLIGAGVSMAMDVPQMIRQMQHGQAGEGLGGMAGTGAGAWGGFLGGAALAAPLDPVTFGLASLVGGGLGAVAGSSLGQHLGSWLGGAISGEKGSKQYGLVQIDQLQIQQLWVDSLTGSTGTSLSAASVVAPNGHSVTPLASGASSVDAAMWSGSGSPTSPDNPANAGTSPGGVVPTIPLGLSVTQASQLAGMSKTQRAAALLPYAQAESKATGLPVDFLLAQWDVESQLGTSALAQSQNNLAGVGHTAGGGYAAYGSLAAFAKGQAAFYEDNSRYDALLNAAQHGASDATLAKDLQASGYAQSSTYGTTIVQVLQSIDQSLKTIRQQQKAQNPLTVGPTVHVNTGLPKRHR